MSLVLDKGAKSGATALLLSAHTDDCELGMGGTIARLVEAGYSIRWLTFCNAWQSLPEGFDVSTLIHEQHAAADAFGLPGNAVTVHDIPVRRFPEYRQDILEILVAAGREVQPDVVFCPSLQDCHQDHLTLAQEAQRAFKTTSLFGYLLPWNIRCETRTAQVEIATRHFERKVAALSCYESQSARSYFGTEAVEVLLKAGGLVSGAEMAEMFEVINLSVPL